MALKALDMPATGNTTDLRTRLTEARRAKLAQQQAEEQKLARQSGSAMPAADAEHEAAAAAAAAAADNELLLAELASFSEEELLACLQDREDTQAGSKQQMIERLAALIVVEAESSGQHSRKGGGPVVGVGDAPPSARTRAGTCNDDHALPARRGPRPAPLGERSDALASPLARLHILGATPRRLSAAPLQQAGLQPLELEGTSTGAGSTGAVGLVPLPLSEDARATMLEFRSLEGQERMRNNTRQALFNVSLHPDARFRASLWGTPAAALGVRRVRPGQVRRMSDSSIAPYSSRFTQRRSWAQTRGV
ncbi:MAG: hypothetical protein WDW38_002516 [Sanguina aurantia]